MKEQWVKMRTKDLGQPHREEFGGVSWRPNFIPYGEKLEIDVVGANKLLEECKIGFPVEIGSYRFVDKEDVGVGGISRNGEGVGKIISSGKKQRKSWINPDWEEGARQSVLLDFSAIYDRASELGGETDKRFSELVDLEWKKAMQLIILLNTFIQMNHEPNSSYVEIVSTIGTALGSIAIFAVGVTAKDPQIIPVCIGGSYAIYLLANLSAAVVGCWPNTVGRGYIEEMRARPGLAKIGSALLPAKTLNYLVIPSLVNMRNSKKLFR